MTDISVREGPLHEGSLPEGGAAVSFSARCESEDAGKRLDAVVSREVLELSRSEFSNRLLSLRVNGQSVTRRYRLRAGDKVEGEIAPRETAEPQAQNIDLDILFENELVVVVNKPPGLVVHPGSGNHDGTLVSGLLYRFPELASRFPDVERPGIVHRLDKDTSGVMIVARDAETAEMLKRQFAAGRVRKRYVAVVKGAPPASEGRVEGCIRRDPHHRKRFVWSEKEGKPSVSEYRVLARFSEVSVVGLAPKTGRTHQLRVHMKHLGCPIVGDTVYGRGAQRKEGMLLHAARLSLKLPGEDERRTFTAPFPERLRNVLAEYDDRVTGEDPRWYESLLEW